jgi:hypothetical protein
MDAVADLLGPAIVAMRFAARRPYERATAARWKSA